MHWNGGAPLYECKLRCIHIVLPLFPLLPLLTSCIHTMLIEGGCIIGRSKFREPLPSPSSALNPYRELRRPLSNRIVLRHPASDSHRSSKRTVCVQEMHKSSSHFSYGCSI